MYKYEYNLFTLISYIFVVSRLLLSHISVLYSSTNILDLNYSKIISTPKYFSDCY